MLYTKMCVGVARRRHRTATACEMMSDDAKMMECAAACRKCAESCRSMHMMPA